MRYRMIGFKKLGRTSSSGAKLYHQHHVYDDKSVTTAQGCEEGKRFKRNVAGIS
jgi:hypothetical protein